PDDERVEGDHDDRPERRVGDEHEVRDRAEYRDPSTHIPRPSHAEEDADTCGEQDDAEYQLDPAPAVVCPVVVVVAIWRRYEDVIRRQGHKADDHAPQAAQHHQGPGQRRAEDHCAPVLAPAPSWRVATGTLGLVPASSLSLLVLLAASLTHGGA